MSDIRTTLNRVLAGTEPPSAFLDAVDTYLAQPDARLDALRSLIDAAEHLGLPPDIAEAARARIPEPDITPIGEPTQVDGDGERTVLTTSDAPTHLRRDPADVDAGDRTEISGPDDRTVVTGDSDRTVVTGDLHRIADSDRTEVTGDSDRTVDAGGIDPFAMASAPAEDDIGPGTVLKGRFRLEEVIGQGGMGAVYKAVDLLKVEARDRNPYMAVKLLVGDFKEHPEAFIALQRESAKAQRLAHPNIATVYDFDRDGDTVYMTMELMVGAELAKYIKKLPAGGLSVPDANKIIEQLCAGLQYAHARGLVHSDFKPGNAFVLDDGSVKLLDFGIARASKTKADAEGESTVFDPGQLGALTPAYATIEMFEGQDPDPRDDIYALACVTYELYTGKHPFNKMSAVKAKEKNLKVAPVAKLNKRQNRTLMKALALHRDDRLASVEAFWEGLKPRKDYTMQIAGGSIAAIVLVGFLAYGPIMNVIHERDHAAIVTEIDSGDEARFLAALGQMDALPEQRRRIVAERARARIFDHFGARAEQAIDADAGRYDFPAAFAEIKTLDRYFPGSSEVLLIEQDIATRRNDLVASLGERFDTLLEGGRLLPDPDAEDITDVVAILRAADPDNERLSSIALANSYVELAQAQIDRRNWQAANGILEAGYAFAPRTADLLDRRDRVAGEIRREREDALVASLRERLRAAAPRTLADFRAARDDLAQLGALRPDDTIVRGYDTALRTTVQRGLDDAATAGEWAAADTLLAEMARALPLDMLIAMRADLSDRQQTAGYDVRADGERAAEVARMATEIRTLLATRSFDDDFDRALVAQFKDITARSAPTEEWQALRTDIAQAYIERAQALAADNRFGIAAATLEQGTLLHPEHPDIATERTDLVAAQRAYQAEQDRLARMQVIEQAKDQIRSYIGAGRLQDAGRGFDALARELPADDPFIQTEGPERFGAAYLELATNATDAQQGLGFARAGLQRLPRHPELQALQAQLERRVAQDAVRADAAGVTTRNFADFRTRYQRARQGLAGNAAAQFDTEVVAALATHLSALDRQGEYSEANALRDSALQVFPGNARLTQLQLRQPSRFAGQVRAAIDAATLTRADELLAEGQRAERDHPDLQAIGRTLEARKAEATTHYDSARATQGRNMAGALASLEQALAIWSDNATFLELQRQLRGTMAPARADDGSIACAASLAGHGARGSRAACVDMVAGQRGPAMVVIPAGGGHDAFAMSRHEVTIENYNHFCASGGGCQARPGDDQLPVTGISIQQADAYIAWLSQTTGKRYRLPTDAEWLYAAGAGSDGRSGDNNCRVVQGGNVIKGHSLARVTTGPSNRWGVANAVGNAQEWVRDGGTLQARGGSFQDPLTNCDVNLVRPHSGAADDVTGFRVMRGID